MFGSKRQYKQYMKLQSSGKKAPAEVTAAEEGHITSVAQPGTMGTKQWKVTVMVRPEGETPFPATVGCQVELGRAVVIGSILTVWYDPNDHSRVMEEQGFGGAIDHMAEQLAAKPGTAKRSDPPATLRKGTADPE